jgi:transcriptional regulator with GAF, ATPase, and Fis domain
MTTSLTDIKDLCSAIARKVSNTFETLSVTIWLMDEKKDRLMLGGSTALTELQGQNVIRTLQGGGELISGLCKKITHVDTFDGAKPQFLDQGKKRRSVSTLSILRASDRGVEWVDTETFEGMLGTSPKMQEVFSEIRKVATTDISVLVLGESGTGKELVAHAIHQRSSRKDRPFVVINCSAIPESLLESELFGHEKGAFTGAHIQRKGRFETAQGGTLFLDEIGELSLAL